MDEKKAIKIALQCILDQMKRYAFDANTAHMFNESQWTPTQKNAVKKYQEYAKAIELLEAIGKQRKLF